MIRPVLAAVLPCVLLAGCGSGALQDQIGDSVWVQPGKYAYHDCLQARNIDVSYASRQKELEELMNRAAQGPGGEAIGQMVYRTEYQQVLGERRQLAALFVQKRCNVEGPSQSGRSVF